MLEFHPLGFAVALLFGSKDSIEEGRSLAGNGALDPRDTGHVNALINFHVPESDSRDQQCQEDDEQKRKDVEIIEAPKIAQPLEKRRSGGRLFSSGQELVAQGQDFFFPETHVRAADFIGVKLAILEEFFKLFLIDFEKVFNLLDGQHVIHKEERRRLTGLHFEIASSASRPPRNDVIASEAKQSPKKIIACYFYLLNAFSS